MDVFAYLFGLIESLYGVLVAVVNFLVAFFQYVAGILYAYIVAVVNFLVAGFKILLSFLVHSINDLIHGRFRDLWNDYIAFRDALRAWLLPLRLALDAYRRTWRILFNTYLRPVLQLITSLRRVLVIFRLLHLKWATTLDNYLGRIESKIIGAYQTVLQAINRHADFLYLLSDPLGFLRVVPMLHSIALASEDIYRLFTGRSKAWWTGDGDTGAAGTLPTVQTSTVWKQQKTDLATGTGDGGMWQSNFSTIHDSIASEIGG